MPHCSSILTGDVIDGESKEILIGAEVFLKEKNKPVITNAKGTFIIDSLCPGKYTLECNYYGYKKLNNTVEVNGRTVLNIVLHADTCLLESVIITAERKTPRYTASTTTLQGAELDRTRGLSLGESLKGIPGVNTLQTGPTIFKPVIQGLYGNRILILNNGVRQEGQQWGTEHAPEIDPFIASSITVVKGAMGVQYGSDAIGGVILVNPRELKKEPGITGEVNLVTLSNNRQGVASGILDYGFKKIRGLSFRVQGSIKQAGNSKTPDYYMKNTSFKERNFSWAAGYLKQNYSLSLFYSQYNTSLGIFSASHIGNLTDLKKALESPLPLELSGFSYDLDRPRQEVSHELFKINSFYKFSKVGSLNLVLARQYNYRAEYDKHRPYNNNLSDNPQQEFKITSHTANLMMELYRQGNFKGSTGISYMLQRNTTSGTVKPLIPNFESHAGGIYLIERWSHSDLEVEAGIRYDYKWIKSFLYQDNVLISKIFSFSNFSGTLGGNYTISKELKISTNLGTSFRPPAVNELFSNGLHHGTSRIEIGDIALRPEYSLNYSLTMQYNLGSLYGEISGYNNYIKNYIYLSPGIEKFKGDSVAPELALTIRGAYPVFRYKQVDGMFTGIDATFNDSLSRQFIISSRLSLLRAYNTKAHEYIILTPPAIFEFGLKYIVRSSSRSLKPYLKFTSTIVAKKNKVPAVQDIKPPPAGYMISSLEGGFTWKIRNQPVDMVLTVSNLFNTRYRDYLDRFRYYTDAVGRNFIIRIKIPLGGE